MSIVSNRAHVVSVPSEALQSAGFLCEMFLKELEPCYTVVQVWDSVANAHRHFFHTDSTLLVLYLEAVRLGKASDVYKFLTELSQGDIDG